ncbi:hypothetical protein PENTCL1PPCAC_10418, partial [Pristionchus entomophagus]
HTLLVAYSLGRPYRTKLAESHSSMKITEYYEKLEEENNKKEQAERDELLKGIDNLKARSRALLEDE